MLLIQAKRGELKTYPERKMNRITLTYIASGYGIRRLLFSLSFIVVLLITGCTSSYNSQRNWNRTPASTGRNRCGCLLNTTDHAIKLYQQPVYALQA